MAAAAATTTTSTATAKDVALAWAKVHNAHDVDALRALCTEDFTIDCQALASMGLKDLDSICGFCTGLFASIKDWAIDMENVKVIADGNTAVLRWEHTGTHTGVPFAGAEANGGSYKQGTTSWLTLNDEGKVTHAKQDIDLASAWIQLGQFDHYSNLVKGALAAAAAAAEEADAKDN